MIVHKYDNCTFVTNYVFQESSYVKQGEKLDPDLFDTMVTIWENADDVETDFEVQKYVILRIEFCYGCLGDYYKEKIQRLSQLIRRTNVRIDGKPTNVYNTR